MLLEIKCTANLAKRAKDWLVETYQLISGFDKVYSMLTSESKEYITPELADMGVPEDECLLLSLEELVNPLDFECLHEINNRGYFGQGTAVKKYISAFTNLCLIIANIKRKAQYMEPFSDEELFALKDGVFISLGNLVYSFGKILFMQRMPREILSGEEEFTYSQDIVAFLADVHMSAPDMAVELTKLQRMYTTTIPLFEHDVAAWQNIIKNIDPGLVDILVDYGEYITVLDVRAIRQGCLVADESFVDLISERAENPNYIANLIPEEWERFIRMIPDEEVPFFNAVQSQITPSLVETALHEKEFTPEYLSLLHELFGDVVTNVAEGKSTNVFGAAN